MDELAAPLMVSRYEDLIAAPEARIRALLSFVDLPWSDDCMSFHRSRRRVNTASYDQVRRPLYSSSVGRAQRYLEFLGPVRSELAGGSEVAD